MDHQGERSHGKQDLGALATSIVDSNLYATLATAKGRPWASPVWFAYDGYRDFFWISRPEARHSRNVAARASARGLRWRRREMPPSTWRDAARRCRMHN